MGNGSGMPLPIHVAEGSQTRVSENLDKPNIMSLLFKEVVLQVRSLVAVN